MLTAETYKVKSLIHCMDLPVEIHAHYVKTKENKWKKKIKMIVEF